MTFKEWVLRRIYAALPEKTQRQIEEDAINESLASTADEIITLHKDGRVERRPGPMSGK